MTCKSLGNNERTRCKRMSPSLSINPRFCLFVLCLFICNLPSSPVSLSLAFGHYCTCVSACDLNFLKKNKSCCRGWMMKAVLLQTKSNLTFIEQLYAAFVEQKGEKCLAIVVRMTFKRLTRHSLWEMISDKEPIFFRTNN